MEQERRESKFGLYAEDYAKHRAGFPPSFFESFKAHFLVTPESTVVDLGTGTGTLAKGFALNSQRVVGLDMDPEMIKAARLQGDGVEFIQAPAEEIPLEDNSVDLVSAGQCWHWFDHHRVLAEVRRVLKPEGNLLVAYMDWIGKAGNPVDQMYQLKPKYVPEEKDHQKKWPLGFYPKAPEDLSMKGFNLEAAQAWEEEIPYSKEAWIGRLKAYNGLGGRLEAKGLERFLEEYRQVALDPISQDRLSIPHSLWFGLWRLD